MEHGRRRGSPRSRAARAGRQGPSRPPRKREADMPWGTSRRLDLLQAQRDAFIADVNRIRPTPTWRTGPASPRFRPGALSSQRTQECACHDLATPSVESPSRSGLLAAACSPPAGEGPKRRPHSGKVEVGLVTATPTDVPLVHELQGRASAIRRLPRSEPASIGVSSKRLFDEEAKCGPASRLFQIGTRLLTRRTSTAQRPPSPGRSKSGFQRLQETRYEQLHHAPDVVWQGGRGPCCTYAPSSRAARPSLSRHGRTDQGVAEDDRRERRTAAVPAATSASEVSMGRHDARIVLLAWTTSAVINWLDRVSCSLWNSRFAAPGKGGLCAVECRPVRSRVDLETAAGRSALSLPRRTAA